MAKAVIAISTLVLLAVVLACTGTTTSTVSDSRPDAPAAPRTTPEANVEPEGSDSDAPAPDASVEATATSPGGLPEDPRIDLGELPEAGLLEAALAYVDSGSIPTGGSRSLEVGSAVKVTEGAEVLVKQGRLIQVIFDSGITAFIDGVNPSSVVTGDRVDLGLVYVAGTQDYTSLLGAGKSGYVLRMIGDSEWTKAVAAARQLEEQSKHDTLRGEYDQLQERIAGLPIDEWTDTSGKHTTRAKFVAMNRDAVTLEREDGRQVDVPWDKLSAASQRKATNRSQDVNRWNTRSKQIQKLLGVADAD